MFLYLILCLSVPVAVALPQGPLSASLAASAKTATSRASGLPPPCCIVYRTRSTPVPPSQISTTLHPHPLPIAAAYLTKHPFHFISSTSPRHVPPVHPFLAPLSSIHRTDPHQKTPRHPHVQCSTCVNGQTCKCSHACLTQYMTNNEASNVKPSRSREQSATRTREK